MLKTILEGSLRSMLSKAFFGRKQELISQLIASAVAPIVTTTCHPCKYLHQRGVCRPEAGQPQS